MPWYAIRVRSNFEHTSATVLQSMGYEVFLPVYRVRRRWSDRMKEVAVPLFTGYLFCSMDLKKRLPVLQAPGVVDLVGCGKTIVPVPDDEIAAVRAMIDSKLAIQPWPYLHVGDKVRLKHGPLAGVEGTILDMRNCTRLVVSISLLQRAVAADVDAEWVQRITESPSAVAPPALPPP
jgi:transcription antitermination factor NusG